MDLIPEIVDRRSIRKYKTDLIDRALMERILKAGQLAPSAKNRQEWRFIVIQKQAMKERLAEAAFGQEHVKLAPAVIVCCTTNIDYRMPNGELSYPIDISFAAHSMMLQAVHEKLGTCCITTYDHEEVKRILNIPFTMRVVMLVLIGEPDENPSPRPRKGIKRISSFDHW